MTTAFVLSGGGSLGSVQVGMVQALAERDVHPDLLIGTSAGAMNAAVLADGWTRGGASGGNWKAIVYSVAPRSLSSRVGVTWYLSTSIHPPAVE